jgi:predicted dienelactone hydrolase
MKRFSMILILLISLLVALSVSAQEDSGPAQVGLRPDAPTYAIRGPYWVGTMDMVIETEAERPVPVTIWYPALNPDNAAESVMYHPVLPWVPPPDVDPVVYGRALLDAAPDTSGAPYPLVVFSHGFAAFPARYAFLPEHLTSHGFVVIAPVHSEHYYYEGVPNRDVTKGEVERPRDIVKALDYAEKLTGPNGTLEMLIDMSQVAVAGHSFGGWTALVAAGARINFEGYSALCADISSDTAAFEMLGCSQIMSEAAEVAQIAGFNQIPEGMWPSWGDPRVQAVITMAGDAITFGKAGLAEIALPVLAMGGTLDTATLYDWGTRLTYDQVSSSQKSLVTVELAEHHIFEIRCADSPWMYDIGASWFCSDPVWDMDRAHDLINHFSTAFLLDVLKGDADAHAALLPENVSFPGITYETTLH